MTPHFAELAQLELAAMLVAEAAGILHVLPVFRDGGRASIRLK